MKNERPENRLMELSGLDVLVVDDDPDALDLIATLLETRHAHVVCASSASEAFACMVKNKPDVLVSDIGMPGEDGYSLIHRVRELPAQRGGSTPAIALTAFNQETDRSRALAAGFSLHLSKPVDVAVLCSEISRLGRLGAAGSAMERLRGETRGLHDRLERSPYAARVLDGSVTLAEYGSFLQAMYTLHRELEQAVDGAQEAEVRRVFREDMRKSVLAAQDLKELGLGLGPTGSIALTADSLAVRLRDASSADPYYLLGAMYVLEGSSLGGRVQRAALLARRELQSLGHRYLSGYQSDTRRHFELFAARLNRALVEERALRRAVVGACETFETMGQVLWDLSEGVASQDDVAAYAPPAGNQA